MRKQERQRFVKKVTQLLLDMGASKTGARFTPSRCRPGQVVCCSIPMRTSFDGLGTLYTCFDDPQAARQLVDCNRFSGKWNHHFFDGWTVETALHDLSVQLRRVLA